MRCTCTTSFFRQKIIKQPLNSSFQKVYYLIAFYQHIVELYNILPFVGILTFISRINTAFKPRFFFIFNILTFMSNHNFMPNSVEPENILLAQGLNDLLELYFTGHTIRSKESSRVGDHPVHDPAITFKPWLRPFTVSIHWCPV